MIYKLTENGDHANADYFGSLGDLVAIINYRLATSYTEDEIYKMINYNTSEIPHAFPSPIEFRDTTESHCCE